MGGIIGLNLLARHPERLTGLIAGALSMRPSCSALRESHRSSTCWSVRAPSRGGCVRRFSLPTRMRRQR
jgi:pimeloyl-ACP methyl ester carboxylesterase